ncbi:MAG TPA: Hsp20/alpha crystallin family protein [Phycisphaerae bacterium]|nr:Hsp20/alpha crystallin family protein [Phycisphaerae bacterium]
MDIVRRRGQRGTGLARLQDEMNDLFGRFFGDWGLAPFSGTGAWFPALDLSEKDDAFVVKAELPGLKPDEIDISVRGNTLTLSGEKKESSEDSGENHYHTERRYGAFRRDVTLPAEVNAEKIEASHRDGVLIVTLPKSEQAKPKKIKISTK